MRVLAPLGVACVKTADGWTKTVKPRPEEIDEWTHYLHDSTNNAVAQDDVVAPPQQPGDRPEEARDGPADALE